MSGSTRALSANPWGPQKSVGLETGIGQLGVLDEETVRRARLAVCERAEDAADAALLLDALGLGGGS